MAVDVIDGLEMVQVQEGQGDLVMLPLGHGQGALHQGGKEGAVGQAGQAVVLGHVADLLLRLSPLRDVAGDALNLDGASGLVAVITGDDLGPDDRAVLAGLLHLLDEVGVRVQVTTQEGGHPLGDQGPHPLPGIRGQGGVHGRGHDLGGGVTAQPEHGGADVGEAQGRGIHHPDHVAEAFHQILEQAPPGVAVPGAGLRLAGLVLGQPQPGLEFVDPCLKGFDFNGERDHGKVMEPDRRSGWSDAIAVLLASGCT